MNPLDIQYELKKKNVSQKAIAESVGCSQMAVSAVVSKKLVSNKIMKAIATAIGRDHREVFPEYYYKTYIRRRPGKTAAL